MEEYWLDVPVEHARAFVDTADPWLAWLAPLAITIGESLTVDAPADAKVLMGVREVVRIWTEWYPHLRSVSIRAPMSTGGGVRKSADRIGSFFTGGVDSFFTVLRERAPGDQIQSLVFVWGFDIHLANEGAWQTALASNVSVANALGVPLVPVVTNLRETRFGQTDWTRLSHGAALAGVALALGGMFHTVLIPSSASQRDLRPWGSHPDTDVMFTSSRTRIIHDGSEWRRAEKTEIVARSDLALRHLRVCYESPHGTNCGKCKRCYRTMLALEAVGALENCATFDRGMLDMRRAARIYCRDDTDRKQFGFVRDLAAREGRKDIVSAIDRSFRRSARRLRVVDAVRRMRDMPVVWRWAPAWERQLLSRWVT
ncbi:MAG: hypothetical protein ACRDMZ_21885 [Solirubrobacteraceae bacterium]